MHNVFLTWWVILRCEGLKVDVGEVDSGIRENRTKSDAHLLSGKLGFVIRGKHLRCASVSEEMSWSTGTRDLLSYDSRYLFEPGTTSKET